MKTDKEFNIKCAEAMGWKLYDRGWRTDVSDYPISTTTLQFDSCMGWSKLILEEAEYEGKFNDLDPSTTPREWSELGLAMLKGAKQ